LLKQYKDKIEGKKQKKKKGGREGLKKLFIYIYIYIYEDPLSFLGVF